MISHIIDFFSGNTHIYVPPENASRAADILLRGKFAHSKMGWDDNGGLYFRLRYTHFKMWKKYAESENVQFKVNYQHGIPAIYKKYKKRFGILIGIIIFAMISVWSSSVIWNIDVKGNNNISDSEILTWLKEMGCAPGTYIKNINFDSLHNNFSIEHPSIAWISVNVNGTWAHVEVREAADLPDTGESGDYTNVVAAEDGVIELVYVYEGRSVVYPGDAVQKGDLIISGAMSVKDTGVRFERGRGKVMARVKRQFTVEVPFKYNKEIKTGEEITKKSIIFFGKRVNLFLNSGIPYENYDTIENKKQIKFFENFEVPVWICTTQFSEKSVMGITLGEAEARGLAELEYNRALNEVLGSGELISREIADMSDENGIKYECEITCSDDIGVRAPLLVNEESIDPESVFGTN